METVGLVKFKVGRSLIPRIRGPSPRNACVESWVIPARNPGRGQSQAQRSPSPIDDGGNSQDAVSEGVEGPLRIFG